MMTRYALLCIIALLTFSLAGCLGNPDKAPGDVFEVTESFEFYLAALNLKHLPLSDEMAQRILVGASWETPEGISLQKQDLKIRSTPVTWRSGNYKYSISGHELTASCLAEVAEDAQPGEKEILVRLPGLAALSSYLKVVPIFPNDQKAFSSPKTLRVEIVNVHGSKASKVFTRVGKWALTIIVVIIVLVIYATVRDY